MLASTLKAVLTDRELTYVRKIT